MTLVLFCLRNKGSFFRSLASEPNFHKNYYESSFLKIFILPLKNHATFLNLKCRPDFKIDLPNVILTD